MTFSRVTTDVFLCGGPPPRPERDDPRHRSWRTGYWWDSQRYLAATTPQRVLTESLASGAPAGARTALRMLGALGLDGHPVWDVLAEGGGPT
jgi:hypothetical protein